MTFNVCHPALWTLTARQFLPPCGGRIVHNSPFLQIFLCPAFLFLVPWLNHDTVFIVEKYWKSSLNISIRYSFITCICQSERPLLSGGALQTTTDTQTWQNGTIESLFLLSTQLRHGREWAPVGFQVPPFRTFFLRFAPLGNPHSQCSVVFVKAQNEILNYAWIWQPWLPYVGIFRNSHRSCSERSKCVVQYSSSRATGVS